MPFKSQAQRRYMHAQHPRIAARWEKEGGTPKHLPQRVRSRDHVLRRRGGR